MFQRVVITGASSGIGKALAREFAASGSRLVLLSRNVDALEQLTGEIRGRGGECYFLPCDGSVKDDVRMGIVYALEQLGGIDLAVLNAGVGDPEWVARFDSERFKQTFAVNVFGIAHGLEFLVPLMLKQGGGVIAGVSSLADVRGYPGSAGYCASKAAASTLLESARVELRGTGVKIVTIRPGFVRTPMTDKNEFKMPFLWEPEKAARFIRKGLERGKRVVQFPLPIILMTRIVRDIPRWLYEMLAAKTRKG